MEWDKSSFIARLSEALERFDRNEVDLLCDALVARINCRICTSDESFAKTVLGNLQRKRYFEHLRRVGDAFIQNGLNAPKIRRQYAQALLDQGELSAAIPFLKTLETEIDGVTGQEFELAEVRGLLGRAYKQTYVSIGSVPSNNAAAAMNAAIKSYLSVYESDPKIHYWHGINAVALLLRAEQDHVAIDDIDDPGRKGQEVAQDILSHMSDLWENRRASLWDSGTAMEACVALGKHDEAATWLQRYRGERQADAFEIGSTLRQLEEIWRLDVDREPGAVILPVLRAELLQRQGGSFTIEAKQLRPGGLASESRKDLEKIFGSIGYHNYKFMLRSIDCARAVVRIERDAGQGYGTGFLVRADELHENLGDGYRLITNAHVVSDNPNVKDALLPDEATVTFELLREEGLAEEEYSIAELVWTSPPWELDTSILKLEKIPEGVKPFKIHPRLPVPDGEQRVYIIGHPRGGSLSFSIQDNVLLDHDMCYLHYRAPTEGGSSGSPVFNAQWKLIGLHHAGSCEMRRLNDKKGTYEANEGISITSIRDAIAAWQNNAA